MRRRKFILGIGATAAGGSTLLGTGAFSKVEAQRAVSVQVAEDPNAYLGLDKCYTPNGSETPNSSYAHLDEDGHLKIFMDEDNPTIGESPLGEGINSDSRTWFDNVFQLCDQGKEDVCLYIEDDDNWPRVKDSDSAEFAGDRRVDFYLEGDRNNSIVGEENQVLLPLGECACVGIKTNSVGLSKGDELLADLGNEITIVADTECAPGIPPEEIPPDDLSNTAISFVAFCQDGDPVTVTEIEIIETNDDGEPVGIDWSTDQPVDEVVLKGGQEWYRYDVDGAMGTAYMSETEADAFYETSPGETSFSFGDDPTETSRCPQSPCAGVSGKKVDYDDGFDTGTQEETQQSCSGGGT